MREPIVMKGASLVAKRAQWTYESLVTVPASRRTRVFVGQWAALARKEREDLLARLNHDHYGGPLPKRLRSRISLEE